MMMRRIKDTWKNKSMPIVIGILLVLLMGIAVYRLFIQARTIINTTIVGHIAELEQIFKKINDTCIISDVTHDPGHIDFLNVASFVSSEVGPLNLVYPKRWEGPYVKDNPSIQGKVYEIVKTKQGYYIVPGKGVRLTNGKRIGKDIIIGPETDMQKLINDGILVYNGKQLVAPFPMKAHSVFFKHEVIDHIE